MSIGTWLFTRRYGERVGEDAFGNVYYRQKGPMKGRRERRWVIYNGEVEASKVPPEWHPWLHHTVDTPPSERPRQAHVWEKPHLANMTGTQAAYRPAGHVLMGGRRAKATGDYEPWTPG